MEKNSIANQISLFFLYFYKKYLSLFFGGNCRFYPSCSNYAIEAFQKHSSIKALYFTMKRILKCHPLGPSGIDLVPRHRKESRCKTIKTS